MKIYVLILTLIFATCQSTDQQSDSAKDTLAKKTDTLINQNNDIDKYVGTYEYIYPFNTESSVENGYIVLEKKGNAYSGRYYGTTDEFDYAREGYECGFFVAPMDQLDIDGETVKFMLMIVNDDVFDQPVDLKYKTSDEARKAGYKNWIQDMEFDPKDYIGSFEDGKITFSDGLDEKVFKRMK